LAVVAVYRLWTPDLDIRDGRHDRGRNGIWLAHGWLGADEWFVRHGKTNQFARYRGVAPVRELAARLRRHHVTDVFPHLCPAEDDGQIPPVDARQTELFLDEFNGIRVIPWIGGVKDNQVQADDAMWRSKFAASVKSLMAAHPRLAGVQLNVEPLPSGDRGFLLLLEELRVALETNKIVSVAAYPPPTRWHPYESVHWNEPYFREVARRCDQMAVMMYDTALRLDKVYQRLMADWTREVLAWSEGKPVLLGVPTYLDTGVGYHVPEVENLTNAILGIHRGLSRQVLPASYQGVAIYCEWETDAGEWKFLREHFLKP
jgi:hypothetical protein